MPVIGKYTIIDEGVSMKDDVFIGNYVHIRPGVFIGEKSEIRDYCFIAQGTVIGRNTRVYQYCNTGGWVRIGDDCFIGPKVIFTNDRKICYPKSIEFVPNAPIVENQVRIGSGAIILPGVTLHEGCVVGAGSVVTKDVPAWEMWVGNPAKKIGEIDC